jgi:hypothetical protein
MAAHALLDDEVHSKAVRALQPVGFEALQWGVVVCKAAMHGICQRHTLHICITAASL